MNTIDENLDSMYDDSDFVLTDYKEGEEIIREGEPGTGAYRVFSGKVKVVKSGGDSDAVLAILEEGTVFGEMSLIDDLPYSATVVAETDVSLQKIDPALYKSELENSSVVIRELLNTFSLRLRNTGADYSFLADLEKKRRKTIELNIEEIKIIKHIAVTSTQLQSIYNWNTAVKIISDSLENLGFADFELDFEEIPSDNWIPVEYKEIDKKYILNFTDGVKYGTVEIKSPGGGLQSKFEEILGIYANLLTSCMQRCTAYEAFVKISTQIKNYITESRINEVYTDFKESLNSFSENLIEKVFAIPDRVNAGENIEDITMELSMYFQETDRLSQEIGMIQDVLNNINKIASGQIPEDPASLDRKLDKKGDQS